MENGISYDKFCLFLFLHFFSWVGTLEALPFELPGILLYKYIFSTRDDEEGQNKNYRKEREASVDILLKTLY